MGSPLLPLPCAVTRQMVVAEARSYLGTPFHDQARVKGVGIDCLGLLVGIAKTFKFADYDTTDYHIPNPKVMKQKLDEYLDPVPPSSIQVADVLYLRSERSPQHLAVVVEIHPELRIVHAFNWPKVMKVVETNAGEYWMRRLAGAYRFRGVI